MVTANEIRLKEMEWQGESSENEDVPNSGTPETQFYQQYFLEALYVQSIREH